VPLSSLTENKRRKYAHLIAALSICQIAGIIGSLFTTPAIPTWYQTLQKPSIAPPNWIFGPVWTTLYLLMGISLYLISKTGLGSTNTRKSLVTFSIQLVLNVLWSYLFFGLRSPMLGLVEIIAMWVAILTTMVFFSKVSRAAALLLVPYLLWVSFASYLNYLIMMLNP